MAHDATGAMQALPPIPPPGMPLGQPPPVIPPPAGIPPGVSVADGYTQDPPCDTPPHETYFAALIATAFFMPVIAAVLIVICYCIYGRWWFAILGAVIAVASWLAFALWFTRYTTVRRANPTVYNQLGQRYAELASLYRQIPVPPDPDHQELYDDIGKRMTLLDAYLRCDTGDLRWVSATGYVKLWRMTHSVEEDLVSFDNHNLALRDAAYDEDRLLGSTVPDNQTLLMHLSDAKKTIANLPAAPVRPPPPVQPPPGAAPVPDAKAALDTLVMVRRKINAFRDTSRAGLLEARNRLMMIGLITGLALDGLVGLAVGYGVSRSRLAAAGAFFLAGGLIGIFKRLYDEFQADADVEDYALSTARTAVVPLLSGIAGLFGVLLVLVPGALNGSLPILLAAPTPTAAIAVVAMNAGTPGATSVTPTGGFGALATAAAGTRVAATATAAAVTPVPTPMAAPLNLPMRTASLSDIFDIEHYPLLLIFAALFGFAPGLFVNKLQQQVNGYKTGLRSSEGAIPPPTGSFAPGPSPVTTNPP